MVFSHWATILKLLKIGISWDAIHSLTETEIYIILAFESVIQDKQHEEELRQMSKSRLT